MNKQIHVAFITPKIKQEWEALKEVNLKTNNSTNSLTERLMILKQIQLVG